MDDTSSDHAESDGKRALPDYPVSAEESSERKRCRADESPEQSEDGPAVEFPEAMSAEDDFLSILYDSNESSDGSTVIHDLHSVIKSFEEEIIVPVQHLSSVVLDPTLEDAWNELGYLLEASDDDLGLPPSFANSADERSDHEVSELPDISSSTPFVTPFDGEMPIYDDFDHSPEISNSNNNIVKEGNEDFLMLCGLFNLPEDLDVPEVTWRPESSPAVS